MRYGGQNMGQFQLDLELGGDFKISNTGGLQLVTGWDCIRQNFERYVFTRPANNTVSGQPQAPDWVFNPGFGLGAGTMIGQVFTQSFIELLKQKVYQGALSAASGNATTPPTVNVTEGPVPNQINVGVVITPVGGQQQTLRVSLP